VFSKSRIGGARFTAPPYCKDFHDMTRSDETTRHAPIAAEVSEERDARRTVSLHLPTFPPEPTR
jgi:hypothetical protein